ncbi:MAG: hypothetical protein ABH879_03555 [archaeon]
MTVSAYLLSIALLFFMVVGLTVAVQKLIAMVRRLQTPTISIHYDKARLDKLAATIDKLDLESKFMLLHHQFGDATALLNLESGRIRLAGIGKVPSLEEPDEPMDYSG